LTMTRKEMIARICDNKYTFFPKNFFRMTIT
jgi:hypothetical protein